MNFGSVEFGLESRNLFLSSTPGVPDLQGTWGNIAKMIK